jgi:hypothetical protein
VVVPGDERVDAAFHEKRPDVFLQRQRDAHVAAVVRVAVAVYDRRFIPPETRVHQRGPVRDDDDERRLVAIDAFRGQLRF